MPFTVAGPVEPEFNVISDKGSGPAGATVQLSGVECVPGLGSFVAVKFMPAGPVPEFDNTDESLEVYEVTDGGASFTGPFVVPAGTAPGTYQFVAWCLGEGGQVLDGTEAQVLGFTVPAAAAPTRRTRTSRADPFRPDVWVAAFGRPPTGILALDGCEC